MIEITDEQNEEYLHLKSLYTREMIAASCASITTLEADIDSPIKRCTAMLALLGCEPLWSCCGFDYAGQPIHKAHNYGTAGFALIDNEYSRKIAKMIESSDRMPFQNRGNAWRAQFNFLYGDSLIYLTSNIDGRGNTWPDKDCIHFSEPGAISIAILENRLSLEKDDFRESVVLRDTNHLFRSRFPNWQYPPKSNWVILKQDYINV